MMDFLEWVGYWVIAFGISTVEWIQRTTEYAGNFFFKSRELFNTVWGRLCSLTDATTYNWVLAAIAFAQKLGEIWEYRYFWVEEVFHELLTKLRQITTIWWARVNTVFNEKWEWVHDWFTDWVEYTTWLLNNYKPRIHLAFVTDWPKLNWLIVERFVDLFNAIEPHVAGWRTFAEDPAQGIWDFVKPRLQELGAGFLVDLW